MVGAAVHAAELAIQNRQPPAKNRIISFAVGILDLFSSFCVG